MRKAVFSIQAFIGKPKKLALPGLRTVAHHANGDVWPTVIGVQDIDKGCREQVILRHGHREQFALAPALQGMDNAKRKAIVYVVAHVRIVNERHGLHGLRRLLDHAECHQAADKHT